MNKSKDIGTRAETAVMRYGQAHGFPGADRLTMRGRGDRGDVGLCPGVIIEVKGGDLARNATALNVERWLDDTYREREHAGAAVGFLVVQQHGVGALNAGRWRAWWRLGWLAELEGKPWSLAPHMPVSCTYHQSLHLLRLAGYGTPPV